MFFMQKEVIAHVRKATTDFFSFAILNTFYCIFNDDPLQK